MRILCLLVAKKNQKKIGRQMIGYGMKFRAKVRLDTQTEIADFVNRVASVSVPVFLTSGALCVSGKSLLGAIYTMEWDELWCECEENIYHLIEDFIVD